MSTASLCLKNLIQSGDESSSVKDFDRIHTNHGKTKWHILQLYDRVSNIIIETKLIFSKMIVTLKIDGKNIDQNEIYYSDQGLYNLSFSEINVVNNASVSREMDIVFVGLMKDGKLTVHYTGKMMRMDLRNKTKTFDKMHIKK